MLAVAAGRQHAQATFSHFQPRDAQRRDETDGHGEKHSYHDYPPDGGTGRRRRLPFDGGVRPRGGEDLCGTERVVMGC